PFFGVFNSFFSFGLITNLEQRMVVFPEFTSIISPGNPQYSEGPCETGISGVYQAVTTISLGISIISKKLVELSCSSFSCSSLASFLRIFLKSVTSNGITAVALKQV